MRLPLGALESLAAQLIRVGALTSSRVRGDAVVMTFFEPFEEVLLTRERQQR